MPGCDGRLSVSRIACSPGVAVRSWAGESTAAVFFEDTVSTHLVNEVAAALLQLAAVQTVTVEEAAAAVFAASPLGDSSSDIGSDLQLLDEAIVGLVAAGLLRRVE
jgi:HJR/Mrr/RecB family endonuclease